MSGAPADKPARMVDPAEAIEFIGEARRFVGRGGEKLEAALDAFGIEVTGLRCLDVGSSTGGFTDCLLKRGAASVVAVDVGRGQLHQKIREDARVTVMERTDIRSVDPQQMGAFGFVGVDVSFISLRTIMESLARLAGSAHVVALVKPQFEVGRKNVGTNGVVKDDELRLKAVADVCESAALHNLATLSTADSVLAGADGNREIFVHFRKAGS